MCNCHSYNWQLGVEEERMVELSGKTVCLDDCIADTVIALNRSGYHTVSSCCGHNLIRPSIVLSNSLSAQQCIEAKKLLQGIDDRNIDLEQWRRVMVADSHKQDDCVDAVRAISEISVGCRGYSRANSKKIRRIVKNCILGKQKGEKKS